MRLIDADELERKLMRSDVVHKHVSEDALYIVLSAIDIAPSIDIVRCKECAYCNVQNTKYLYAICERHGIEFKPFEDDTRTHGCAWGERSE